MTFLTKKLEKTIAPSGPGKVVDIKKYYFVNTNFRVLKP